MCRLNRHAETTCVTNPVRNLSLLKNRLTAQIKFPCMILMLKVHRNTSGQLRCSFIYRTMHSPTNRSYYMWIFEGPTMRNSHLRESDHKTLFQKSGFSSSVFNTKLQKSKRRSWSPGISSRARTNVICSIPSILSRNKSC